MVFEHNCNKANCDHESANDYSEEWSLNSRIDINNVQCLNERVDGSCKKIFRPWDDRLNRAYSVSSDTDQELLFNIPFNGSVKIKSITVIGANDDTHPSVIRLYKNRPYMSFDDATAECDQEIELIKDPDGLIAYPLKAVKFPSVTHLSIHIPRNYANDDDTSTTVYYIGLKGEFLTALRQQIVITNYESQANPADHQTTNITNSKFQDIA